MSYTAAEPAVRDFLGFLTKALRPRYVIETGSFRGDTARAIGENLEIGHLDSLEIVEYSVIQSAEAVTGLPVTVHLCDSRNFIPDRPIDLCFLDSDPNIRFQEAEHFRPFLAPDAVIAIHDSRDMHWGELDWRWVQLGTPRGLLLLQDA